MAPCSRRAFTLVEIVVVLAIVGILAALLFSAFARVRENGRKTACLSNVRQIMSAVALYTQDSAGQYPRVVGVGALSGAHFSWADGLLPYLSAPEVLHCPSDGLWEQRQKHSAGFTPSSSQTPSSYLINSHCLTVETVQFTSTGSVAPLIVPAFERDVPRPASTVFSSDGAQNAWGQAPYTQDYPEDLASAQAEQGNTLRDPAGTPETNSCCDPATPFATTCLRPTTGIWAARTWLLPMGTSNR